MVELIIGELYKIESPKGDKLSPQIIPNANPILPNFADADPFSPNRILINERNNCVIGILSIKALDNAPIQRSAKNAIP